MPPVPHSSPRRHARHAAGPPGSGLKGNYRANGRGEASRTDNQQASPCSRHRDTIFDPATIRSDRVFRRLTSLAAARDPCFRSREGRGRDANNARTRETRDKWKISLAGSEDAEGNAGGECVADLLVTGKCSERVMGS